MNYCLQKQACVQKVASSSPKTSWGNVVSGDHERGLTHPLTDDAEGTFQQGQEMCEFKKVGEGDPFSVTLGSSV